MFITEVDNMSYMFGLVEKQKERVDTYGHVQLREDEARQLARTKVLCVVATVASTIFSVNSGATVATLMVAGVTVLVFKLSELATKTKRLSRAEIALFVAASLASFIASMALGMGITMGTWYNSIII